MRHSPIPNETGMISAVTGEPVSGLLYEPRRRRWSRAAALVFYAAVVALLWLAPATVPDMTSSRIQLPHLVFMAEPGPGGGGGGGGENDSNPPSVQKVPGEDKARLALRVDEPEDELVYEEEQPAVEEPKDEPIEEIVEPAVQAPVVAQAPNDFEQKGVLEGVEQAIESSGSGSGGGSGTGRGTGIGEGDGSGIGPGYGGGFGGGAYRVGSGVQPPVLRRQVRPSYTDKALSRKIDGVVLLEIIILRDGTVGPVRVLRSLDPELDEKAIQAVRQWLFVPGKLRGEPVDVVAEVQVDFSLL